MTDPEGRGYRPRRCLPGLRGYVGSVEDEDEDASVVVVAASVVVVVDDGRDENGNRAGPVVAVVELLDDVEDEDVDEDAGAVDAGAGAG
ncbi:MAG TPA: hypothetical protein VHL53_09395, partial [Acidimicrobiia bacterium]|nr:hypothetical protein [Acidimicrobiia bacterium]